MKERLKVCYDRVLPTQLSRPHDFAPVASGALEAPTRVRAVLPNFRKLWLNGSTLRVRFMGGSAEEQRIAKEQAGWWTEHANLRFDFNNALDAEIRVAFNPNDGAWSYIGTDCKQIPQDQPTMNLGFLEGGTAAHEFGHAIGLGHEHQNPNSGIQWNEEAVLRDLSGPPNFWTPEQIRHNVLEKYSGNLVLGTEFDPESIMLYFFPDSWVIGGHGTKANEVLSKMDKEFIESAKVYPRIETTVTELKVDGPAVRAKIGKPGEEDVFCFMVGAPGRYIVQTSGRTDVVMKLFGPGSRTNLIAEDDDSGVGMNARIVTDLAPGEYFIQVRHYNTSQGIGRYSVMVEAQ